jgi:hypothetical protein
MNKANRRHEGLSRSGTWDRELDRPTPKATVISDPMIELLAEIGRLGLALFLTARFAAGMSLNNDTRLARPEIIQICMYLFSWLLVLISCMTCRHT